MKKALILLLATTLLLGLAACSGTTVKPGNNGGKTVDPPKTVKNPTVVDGGLKFVYKLKVVPQKDLFLAGGFNGWNPLDSTYQLSKGADGTWSCVVKIDKGRWEYKFVVDGQMYPDLHSKELESDGTGGQKSLVTVQ